MKMIAVFGSGERIDTKLPENTPPNEVMNFLMSWIYTNVDPNANKGNIAFFESPGHLDQQYTLRYIWCAPDEDGCSYIEDVILRDTDAVDTPFDCDPDSGMNSVPKTQSKKRK